MHQELDFILRSIFNHHTNCKWEIPIAHIIPHDPTFQAWGDSSLFTAGGLSFDLKIWWYMEWPEEIQQRNIKHFKVKYCDYKTGKLISINLLEFAVIIINYAISAHIIP